MGAQHRLPAVPHRVLITGGAGFVGANLAVALAARHPDWELVALDNLKRRGSELNLPRLKAAGVRFVHGDIRSQDDLQALPHIDAMVECSAEPSVMAGVGGSTGYVVEANLVGAYNCFELARRDGAHVVFLSTSRVYPYEALDAMPYEETDTRFELDGSAGVAEDFPLAGRRTFYGATKLAAELLLGEYDLPWTVNRFGVIAGPWQMGKVDQGVFTFWALAHHLGRPLAYIGYGGQGKQVRDLLHVDDVVDLIDEQLSDSAAWSGWTANVGGGREVSLSLRETTALCAELTGTQVPATPAGEDRPGDVRIYLTDNAKLFSKTAWRPKRDARTILADTVDWIRTNEDLVVAALS
jgi:CDP-paratose 2-epimerase